MQPIDLEDIIFVAAARCPSVPTFFKRVSGKILDAHRLELVRRTEFVGVKLKPFEYVPAPGTQCPVMLLARFRHFNLAGMTGKKFDHRGGSAPKRL
ncbi:MAG: hypothetical protein R3C56_34600 [Pirellulaceae bacterium]